ncbi:uncharacterized protein LOC110730322 isoform X2 [Chenopodium quinoa]|uniref:uncharacterized protein LOC110730322 isoform X2 n=1 Tax=Chenopodium quinoa TaxID=63459 RepID=UPI000B79A178|nr:uncharacterized protein LOC110730322 isoform X2 [Chenopodium quinoa]
MNITEIHLPSFHLLHYQLMVMQMGTPMQIFPVYNPGSHPAKKEKSRLRSAENAIHLIPLVLLLCAVILWFFSNPVLLFPFFLLLFPAQHGSSQQNARTRWQWLRTSHSPNRPADPPSSVTTLTASQPCIGVCRLAVYTYYTMSLESFWKRAGKSQKSSTCSSPSSRDPPIEEHVSPNDDEVPIAATIPPPENTGPSVPNTTVDSDDTRIYDVDLLPHDPGKRIPIMEYPPNDRDVVRRGYITKKRCDPRTHNFPQRKVGGMRRFNVTWFDKYEWLEYSVEKDAAFCFVCYLFTDKVDYSLAVNDSFIKGGFRGWNKTGRFDVHVGGIGSFHNQANEKYSMFINSKTSVAESLCTYSKEAKLQYKSRLTYSLKCIRFLLNQGLACRGHNESEESWNRGNFLALLTWFSENNSEVAKVVLGNALGNNRMTSPSIQKELINCCAKETTRLLIDDIGDDYFRIMADESSDVS